MRISDWSSDVCSSDLCHVVDQGIDPGVHPTVVEPCEDGHHRRAEEAVLQPAAGKGANRRFRGRRPHARSGDRDRDPPWSERGRSRLHEPRSEEHTSELQSLMRTSSAVFCLKNKYTTLNTE